MNGIGRIEGTTTIRQEVTGPLFNVAAIASARVPAGIYECYVVAHGRATFGRVTGVTTQVSATTYVRPELGVILTAVTGVSTGGIEAVTLTLVFEATSIQ